MSAADARATPSRARDDRRLGREDLPYCLGLLAGALSLRVVLVLALGVEPTWDGQFYHQGAVSIAGGHGYSEASVVDGVATRTAWSHYPVGYSALIGGAYALFGESERVALLANAVVGALTALLAFGFALTTLGRKRARVAGILVGLHPGLSLYCVLMMTEPLAGFFLLATGWLVAAFGRRRWAAAAAGLCLGLGALVRPQSLLAGPLLAFLFPGPLRARARQTAIAAATTVLALAPWSARNCLVLDGCALVSTNGGWNLAIGALSETGRYRPLTAEDGCTHVDGPVAQDRCWAGVGLAAIRRDPLGWLARAPDKLRHTYNHESFAVAYIAEAEPDEWDRDRKWGLMNVMTSSHHLLMLVAAFGTLARFDPRRWRSHLPQAVALGAIAAFVAYALSRPERPLFWLGVFVPVLGFARLPGAPPLDRRLGFLLGLLAVTTLTHVVFFGDDRYHLAVSPVFCILAAAAFRRPSPATATASSLPRPLPVALD